MSSSTSRPLLVTILGPTAVGKTSLSIELAKYFKAHIISSDSRQMYKDISIGTAKPTEREKDGVPHHFLDFLELDQEYSAGHYERDALDLIQNELKPEKIIFLCGGSGLYVKALLEGLDDLPKSEQVRKDLIELHRQEGLSPLLLELERVDPITFERIDRNNPQRVIRALEVCRLSARPFSSFHENKKKVRPFDSLVFGLRRERSELNERIASRFDGMMKQGWVEEAESVRSKSHLNSLNTVGYKQVFQFINGEVTYEECRQLIVRETQRFAKRQMTWFNRTKGVEWIELPDDGAVQHIVDRIKDTIGR